MFKVCLSFCWHFYFSRTDCDKTNTSKTNKLLRFLSVSSQTQSWKSYKSSGRNWQIDKRRIWNLKHRARVSHSPPDCLYQWWIKELRCCIFVVDFSSTVFVIIFDIIQGHDLPPQTKHPIQTGRWRSGSQQAFSHASFCISNNNKKKLQRLSSWP